MLEAEDGAQGLELAETEPVDIIFSGCQLPDMDGPNFTRKIRSLPEHKETPVVVISDSPDDERKEAAKSAGGTGWMVQPVMPEKLIEAAEGFAARIDLLEAKAKKKAELKKKKGRGRCRLTSPPACFQRFGSGQEQELVGVEQGAAEGFQ